jgi:ribosomal protection tetracycline resistance protein
MGVMNLGILAHIDAGKTSLTERLLYDAGALQTLGSVDGGDTYTDSLEVERRRGITIRSAVAGVTIGGIDVNIIDTPGHPDFIAEVERVLGVLDGAILVLSAVEGIQAQTRVLFRTLRRLGVPMLIFVNKVDRVGARVEALVEDIEQRLAPNVVRMSHVTDAGTAAAITSVRRFDEEGFAMELAEALAEDNEEAMKAFVAGNWPDGTERIGPILAEQAAAGQILPVFFGSATHGEGIEELMTGIATLLPRAKGTPDGALSAAVFKIERGNNHERIAYVRVFNGTMSLRTKQQFDEKRGGRVTRIDVFRRGEARAAKQMLPGDIGRVWGLGEVRIGDTIGDPAHAVARRFSPPTLETLIVPLKITERGALLAALTEMSEQDPLINVRQDDIRQEVFISLFGEVQKEVIGENLLSEYGIEVEFRETTTVCIERLVGSGEAGETLKTPSNPFLATIGLRVEPLPPDSGNRFALEVELGSIPLAFHRAVEEIALKTLEQGLMGWNVTDCLVTMTDSGYLARQSHSYSAFDKSMSSTAGDFRNLTPLVLMDALRRAGTVVCEPINRFYLEIPVDLVGTIFPVLTRHGAAPGGPSIFRETAVIEGTIPAANLHNLHLMLPHVTRGEGSFESNFDHYEPIVDRVPPARRRTDKDPGNRKLYFANLGIRPQ